MSSRRLDKISKAIQGTVSEVIQNRLADPRIQGMVSVTRVEVSADLRRAWIYLSILGVNEKQQALTLQALQHARGVIQGYLADRLTTKTCPTLKLSLDDSFKKSLKVMELLSQAASEYRQETDENQAESGNEKQQ